MGQEKTIPEVHMQTLPDYPATVRRDETGNIITTAPGSQKRTKNHTHQSSIDESASRGSDLIHKEEPEISQEKQLEKLKKETLASEGMTVNSSIQKEQEDGKFKVYGMNNAAAEFNQIVKDKQRKNKFKTKIKDWSIRQDLKKIKQQELQQELQDRIEKSLTK